MEKCRNILAIYLPLYSPDNRWKKAIEFFLLEYLLFNYILKRMENVFYRILKAVMNRIPCLLLIWSIYLRYLIYIWCISFIDFIIAKKIDTNSITECNLLKAYFAKEINCKNIWKAWKDIQHFTFWWLNTYWEICN